MSIIFKVNYRFNTILIKTPTTLLQIKSVLKFKKSQKAKTILNSKNEAGSLTLPNFKLTPNPNNAVHQTYRLMNLEPRNKLLHIQSNDSTRVQRACKRVKKVFATNGIQKTGQLYDRKSWTIIYTMHKN